MKSLQNISYKTLFTILFLSLAGIVFFLRIGKPANKVSAAWWDEMWHYRKAISIDNTSGSNLTDFQVSISIGTSQLIADGKMQTDCDDLRITDINGNLLPYWIEENNPGCNQLTDTKVWLKTNSLPTSGSTIYVYYGNPSASNNENGDNVFDFFDDFNDAIKTQSNWTATGTGYTVAGGNLYHSTTLEPSNSFATYTINNSSGFTNGIIESRMKPASCGSSYGKGIIARYSNDNNEYIAGLEAWTGNYNHIGRRVGGAWTNIDQDSLVCSTSTWYQFKWTLNGTNQFLSVNGVASSGVDTSLSSGKIGVHVDNKETPTGAYWDYIFVHKYASSEPTVSPQSEELSPAPIAYWKFDEGVGTTAYDSAGNNNGTLSGTTLPEWQNEDQCISGKCLNFQGLSSTHNSTLTNNLSNIVSSSTSFTMTAWINLHGPPTNYCGVIISAGSWNTDNGYWKFGIHYAGGVYTGPQLGYGNAADMSYVFQLNKWYFLTWISNNGTNYFYVDGKYIGSSVDSAYSTTTIPKIGQASYGNYFNFNGLIDDLKIYNYIRTADQIKQDYNSRGSMSGSSVNLGVRSNTNPSIKSSLVAYYKFDENNGTTTYDSSGNNLLGTFTGTTIPTWSSGKYNSGVNFNGVNSYIDLGNSSPIRDFTDQITVSIWAKYNAYGGGGQSYSVLAVKGSPWTFLMENPSNKIRFRVTVGGIDKNATDSQVHNLNQWYHFVGTYDGQNIKIYKNGILAGTTPATGNLNVNNVSAKIGTYTGTTYNFNGLIDEVKIYNRALTAEEIKQDYNQGSVVQFGTTNQTIGGTTTSLEYCIPGDTSYCAPPVAEWKMDEGTGTSIVDTSGNNYTSTYYGSPIKTQGKIGQAISFNGTDNGISLNGPTTYSKETISAWVYIDSSSPSGDIVGNCHTNFNTYGFSLYLDGNTLRAKAAQNAITYFYNNVTYNVSLLKNKWIHLAMSWENLGTGTGGCDATAKLYINGQMVSVGTTNFSGGYDCTKPYWYPFSMGGTTQNSLTRLTKVKLDQVRVYNYARTPAQIAYDYNKGGPVGWWKLDECQGNIAYDWSGIGNTGVINIGPSGTQNTLGTCAIGTSAAWTNGSTGKINSSLNFDGIDDYISIPDNPILNTNTEDFTISFWGKSLNYVTSGGIINKGLYWTNGPGYAFTNISNPQRVYFNTYDGTTQKYINTGIGPTYDWTHFIGLKKGATIEVWINGKYLTSNSAPSNSLSNNSSLILGRGTGGYWDGQIDDVRIYNYALTAEQVKQVYNGGAVNFR